MNNNIKKLENGDFEVEHKEVNKTIIWSKNQCNYCVRAKRLMDKHEINYEERNIEDSEWTMERLLDEAPGIRTMPQIFMDGKHIGGFDDLDAYMFLKYEAE